MSGAGKGTSDRTAGGAMLLLSKYICSKAACLVMYVLQLLFPSNFVFIFDF